MFKAQIRQRPGNQWDENLARQTFRRSTSCKNLCRQEPGTISDCNTSSPNCSRLSKSGRAFHPLGCTAAARRRTLPVHRHFAAKGRFLLPEDAAFDRQAPKIGHRVFRCLFSNGFSVCRSFRSLDMAETTRPQRRLPHCLAGCPLPSGNPTHCTLPLCGV